MTTAPKHLKDLDVFEKRYGDSPTEYGALYDADGDLVVARHGEEKSIEFTPEELEKAKGGVLSHDHPHGHDLSSADMALALQHDLEIRATGHTPWGFRTYSVMPHGSVQDTTPLTQYYEQTYKSEKAAGKDPYKAREATVAKTAKQFGMTRKVFNRNDIIREYSEDEPRDEHGRWTSDGGADVSTPAVFDKPITSVEYFSMAEAHAKDLNDYQKSLVNAYTGDDFQMVNSSMRNDNYDVELDGEKTNIAEPIDHLKQTISDSKLPEDISVYRGFSEKRYANLEVGSTVEDKAFISTTQRRVYAERFYKTADDQYETPDRKIFQLNLPKGHEALAVAYMSRHPYEREIMLNPQLFVVTKIENSPREGGGTLTTYHLAPAKESGHVIREGLETEEQRAWWFWNLKNGGNYEAPGKDKTDGSFKTKFQTNVKAVATAKATAQPGVTNDSPKSFDKPMSEASYEKIAYHQTDALTDEQRQSVRNYSGSSYHDINGAMRTGKYESEWGGEYPKDRIADIDNHIQLIKDSIDANSLDKDVSVYRGFSDRRYSNLEVGSTIEDKGFVSTSISKGTAISFYKPPSGNEWDGRNKIFQIDLPQGHPSLAIKPISQSKIENEIILNPQKFVVTGVSTLKAKSSYDRDTIVYHLSPTGNGKSH